MVIFQWWISMVESPQSSSHSFHFILDTHIPPGEKENHLQNAIFGGYVSSLEGTDSQESVEFLVHTNHLRIGRGCLPQHRIKSPPLFGGGRWPGVIASCYFTPLICLMCLLFLSSGWSENVNMLQKCHEISTRLTHTEQWILWLSSLCASVRLK